MSYGLLTQALHKHRDRREEEAGCHLAGQHRVPVVTAGDQIHSLPLQEQSQLQQGSAVQDRNVAGRASITPAQGLEHSHCQVPGAHSRACPNIDTNISNLNLATRNLHGWECPPLWSEQHTRRAAGSHLLTWWFIPCSSWVQVDFYMCHPGAAEPLAWSPARYCFNKPKQKQKLPGFPSVCCQSCPQVLPQDSQDDSVTLSIVMDTVHYTQRYCSLLWLLLKHPIF